MNKIRCTARDHRKISEYGGRALGGGPGNIDAGRIGERPDEINDRHHISRSRQPPAFQIRGRVIGCEQDTGVRRSRAGNVSQSLDVFDEDLGIQSNRLSLTCLRSFFLDARFPLHYYTSKYSGKLTGLFAVFLTRTLEKLDSLNPLHIRSHFDFKLSF
jgi:hypothetical protein